MGQVDHGYGIHLLSPSRDRHIGRDVGLRLSCVSAMLDSWWTLRVLWMESAGDLTYRVVRGSLRAEPLMSIFIGQWQWCRSSCDGRGCHKRRVSGRAGNCALRVMLPDDQQEMRHHDVRSFFSNWVASMCLWGEFGKHGGATGRIGRLIQNTQSHEWKGKWFNPVLHPDWVPDRHVPEHYPAGKHLSLRPTVELVWLVVSKGDVPQRRTRMLAVSVRSCSPRRWLEYSFVAKLTNHGYRRMSIDCASHAAT